MDRTESLKAFRKSSLLSEDTDEGRVANSVAIKKERKVSRKEQLSWGEANQSAYGPSPCRSQLSGNSRSAEPITMATLSPPRLSKEGALSVAGVTQTTQSAPSTLSLSLPDHRGLRTLNCFIGIALILAE